MGPSKHGPTLAGLHDVELAVMAAAGARAAFGELAKRHGSAVRALLRRMGADPTLADDLAQDAFLSAFEHIAEFRGEGPFAGWIKRIAARLYIKRWKRRAQLDPVSDKAEFEASTGGEGMAASLLDLDEALKTLSSSERICITLCFAVGLSHAEAATALKSPLGTVKSHTRRGMAKLRARLAPEGLAGDPARRSGLE